MKTLLRRLFFDHWQRKLSSVILAIIIWFLVNQSLITSRTISNVPIRVINIPAGKTVSDLQSDGTLSKRATLTLAGNKNLLDELSASDLEVVIDANNKKGEWIETISNRNLTSINASIDLSKGITRVSSNGIIISLTKLVTEKIPIFVTQPIGEAPRDYQYLDIWPYQLTVNVSGPEEVVKRLKTKGHRLTFDLSNITKTELDALKNRPDSSRGDEISFFVPDQWKRISLPLISDTPIEIDDPRAKDLRIDFVRVSLLPINSQIPVSLYFTTESLSTLNPRSVSLAPSPYVEKVKGLSIFAKPLFAKGVSHLFMRVVEHMVQMTITVEPTQSNDLNWSVEFINPRLLEDRYVSLMMSDISDEEVRELQPLLREEYLRNRFRSYMNRFQLYKSDDKRLDLNIHLDHDKVIVEEGLKSLPNSSFLRKSE